MVSMGILREIIDTIRDVSSVSAGSVEDVFKKKKYSSLSRRSLEGTLQFPAIVSKSLDIDTLQMVSKALERQYASFVQVSLTMSPMLNLEKDKDAAGYLRKFHQNSNVKVGLNDIMNLGVDVLENYTGYTDDLQQVFMFATVTEGSTTQLVAANREQLQSVFEGIREDVLNNKFIPRNNLYRFKNDNLNHYHNNIVTEAKNDKDLRITNNASRINNSRNTHNHGSVDQSKNNYSSMGDVDNSFTNTSMVGGDNNSNNTSNTNQTFTGTISNITMTGGGGKSKFDEQQKIELPNNTLRDNDVKKSNELVPTTMHVRTYLVNKEGQTQGSMDFIIGVKTTMHPIASDEIVSNLLSGVKSKGKFFNTVRWTSGEIGFFKDFLFNIKDIKRDVSSRSAGASPWWIALKRRRALSKIKGAMMLPNQILPNASVVISMEEVEYIKSHFGYDLMVPGFVDKIMDQYFLLGFVIVDNSTQMVHFLFDGHQDFQTVTFNGLERDARGGGGVDFKDVLKLVQRV